MNGNAGKRCAFVMGMMRFWCAVSLQLVFIRAIFERVYFQVYPLYTLYRIISVRDINIPDQLPRCMVLVRS
jgi:hypothetical protein